MKYVYTVKCGCPDSLPNGRLIEINAESIDGMICPRCKKKVIVLERELNPDYKEIK